MRALVAAAPSARLGTIAADGRAHLVPIVFALLGETIVTAVDHKPKRTRALARLANLRRDPRATVLVDHYHDDWSALWWVRIDGAAAVLEGADERAVAIEGLAAKYAQYRERPPDGPVISIVAARWTGWCASPLTR